MQAHCVKREHVRCVGAAGAVGCMRDAKIPKYKNPNTLWAPGACTEKRGHVRCVVGGEGQLGPAASDASFDTGMPHSHPTSPLCPPLCSVFSFFPFSHFSFPGAGSCLRVLLHLPGDAPPCRPAPTHPYSTPSFPLTRSKEVSGVTVSTACRLSAPSPPPHTKKPDSAATVTLILSCLSGNGATTQMHAFATVFKSFWSWWNLLS